MQMAGMNFKTRSRACLKITTHWSF
ncbi:DUF6783 domain-containing protein [Robinsoniella peoriensis]